MTKLHTFTTDTFPDELKWLFKEAAKDNTNPLQLNYEDKDVINEYTLCYSVTMNGDRPISGSVAWNRPFYQNSSIRVATRYYVHPSFRLNSLRPDKFYSKGVRKYIVEQVDQQVKFCESLGYFNQFISREDDTGRLTARICKGFNEHSVYEWNLAKHKYQVCPNAASPSCWQRIIYKGDAPCLNRQ